MPWSTCGFGTEYFGQRGPQPDGSYVTTEFVTAFGIPLVPLRSRRVREVGPEFFGRGGGWWIARQQYEVRAVPTNWRQVLNVYLGAMGFLLALVLAFVSPILLLGDFDKDPAGQLIGIALLVLAVGLIAVVVYAIRRRKVRLRAEWAKMGSAARASTDKETDVIYVDTLGVATARSAATTGNTRK
jgi:hypothetical protein